MLKRKVSLFILLISTMSLVILFQYVMNVSAQPSTYIKHSVQDEIQRSNPIPYLTSSNAFTLYLPLIFKRWPMNEKKGVGVLASPACTDLDSLFATWYVNWQTSPDLTCEATDNRFVPRIGGQTAMARLSEAVANAQYSGWLIGFNEPNLPFQSNISPQQAAILWKQIEDAALPQGVKLVSPAPSQHSPGELDPYGYTWLWAMVDAYKGMYGGNPHFDAIGWNLYGCTNHPNCFNVAGMKSYLTQRRQEALDRGYNVPIWLMEFGGCLTDNSLASDTIIMTEMATWMNATSWIGRYAWFSNRKGGGFQGGHECNLVNSDGSLTQLGMIYQAY